MTRILTSIPVIALTIAFVCLGIVTWFGVRRGVLGRVSRGILVACILLVVAGLWVLIDRATRPSQSSDFVQSQKFDVTVDLQAPESRHTVTSVPFRVGSGSINLGCEEMRSASVHFELPTGAEQTTASAEWQNTDNLDAHIANVEITPTVVLAKGYIRGRQKTFLFNCPGGGHGELILQGQYALKHVEPGEPTLIKRVNDIASRGQVFTVALPNPVTQTISISVAISLHSIETNRGDYSSTKGTIAVGETGALVLTINSKRGPLPSSIHVEGNTLIVVI